MRDLHFLNYFRAEQIICHPEKTNTRGQFHDNYGSEACFRCGEGGCGLLECPACVAKGRVAMCCHLECMERPVRASFLVIIVKMSHISGRVLCVLN